ncbi:hypothetical protein TSUD_201740 [Trifolium subterraneum]|uniref:t-SNARE coiled-coil homology domain-containing protein n=1 Tax=Trifolium subterraneum TaxID=3900 RepID=A0A2Z6LPG3_TRISU|nr:hypothetical protein TSUD_201740 [Trifolium subterraneum]
MATRNRTLLFRKYRDALKSVRAPSASSPPSKSSAGGPVIELVSTTLLNQNRSYAPLSTEDPGNSSKGINPITVGLPPAWVDVSEEISANVQRARTKMAELSKAHSEALMPSFVDGKDKQHAIESLTHEITDLIKRSEKRLRRLAATGPSEDSNVRKNVQKRLRRLAATGPSEDSNVRKNVQRSLATDLQSLSVELRKKQSSYLKRLRLQKEDQDGVDLEINMNGSKSRYEDVDLDNMIFNEHQMAKLKKSEAFTVEREKEIQQVVESVNELAQIMKDLSVLVIDQGTIVDRIDYNIQNVATTVEDGLKQLQKVILLFILFYFGRENSEKGRHGNVCVGASYHVLCYVGSPSN